MNTITVVIRITNPSTANLFKNPGKCGNQICGLCGCLRKIKIKSEAIARKTDIVKAIALIFVVKDIPKKIPVKMAFFMDGLL